MMVVSTITMDFRYDYPILTEEDAQKIQDYCVGKITLTDEELKKYDVNMDGVVDIVDALVIKKMIVGTDDTYSAGKLVIDPNNPKRLATIKIIDGYKSGKEYYIGVGGAFDMPT